MNILRLFLSTRTKINSMFLKYRLRKNNVYISNSTNIEGASFERFNKIGHNCLLRHSRIGIGTYICNNSSLPFSDIGKFCSIGPNVSIAVGNHPTSDFVSTHPAFFSTLNQAGFHFVKTQKYNELKYVDDQFMVKIGNDVWIGSNVTILNGLIIGDGAVIAAGSVVTKNIEPYSINAGVPAKMIKKRFLEQEDISFLLNLNWWEKDWDWIKKYSEHFHDVKIFRELIEKEKNVR